MNRLSLPVQWRGHLLAVVLGILSGFVASLVGLPLPWFLGPMIGLTLAAVLDAPIATPNYLRPLAIPVLGVMLGSAFSPDLIDVLGAWTITLLLVPVFAVIASLTTYIYYRRAIGWDQVTSFFSAMPGGANEMVILGGQAGGDERQIAFAHAIRIIILVTLVVFFFAFFLDVSLAPRSRPFTGFSDLRAFDGPLLLLCALIGPALARRAGFPMPLFFGPLALSAALHLFTIVEVPPPTVVTLAAQTVLGTYIGCRFIGVPASYLMKNLIIGLGGTAVILISSVLVAWLVFMFSGVPVRHAFLAFAPGGITEMSLLALAMGQEIAYVTTAHVVRFTLITLIAPLLFGLALPRLQARAGSRESTRESEPPK